jgi:hypothetical protein
MNKSLERKYIEAWKEFQKYSRILSELKPEVLERLDENGKVISGYKLIVAERPVFSEVSLGTARTYGAVIKVPDTKKLNQILKTGEDIKGVKYSKYIHVQSL